MTKTKKEDNEKLTLEKAIGQDQTINYTDNRETNDQISLLAISELLDMKKLKTISRVKFEQVQVLTKLYMFEDVFDIPFTEGLADNILKLQISTNGLGRRDLVQLVQQRDVFGQDVQTKRSKDIFR